MNSEFISIKKNLKKSKEFAIPIVRTFHSINFLSSNASRIVLQYTKRQNLFQDSKMAWAACMQKIKVFIVN